MSGVRVYNLPDSTSIKDIKIYFSKPENGGGEIKHIYFPLLHDEAVVLFANEHVADMVISHSKPSKTLGKIEALALPRTQMYTVLTAELSTSISQYLEATASVLDEIKFVMDLKYDYDVKRNISTLKGNWFQLEWAWKYVEDLMQQQSRSHEKLMQRSASHRQEEMDVEEQDPWSGYREPLQDRGGSPVMGLPSSGLPQNRQNLLDRVQRDKSPDRDRQDDHSNHSDGEQSDDSFLQAKRNNATQNQKPSGREAARRGNQHDSSEDEDDEDDDGNDKVAGNIKGNVGTAKGSKMTEILNDKPDDPRSLDFRHGPIHVSIFTGNITYAETDAIVNASNEDLQHYGGVAYAIQSAAGAELKIECDKYVRDNGRLKVADVMHTSAGGKMSSNVKYVIHAVGPMMSQYYVERSMHDLTRTFLNTMTYANKHLKIKSITLPLISSGVFGGSLDTCVQAFVDAVLIFVREHCSGMVNLQEVHLINNNTDSTVETVLHVRGCLNKDLDRLTDTVLQQFEKMSQIEDDVLLRSRAGKFDTGLSASLRQDRYKSLPVSFTGMDKDFSRSVRTTVDDSFRTSSTGATRYTKPDKDDYSSGFSSMPYSPSTNYKTGPMRSLSSGSTGSSGTPLSTGGVSSHLTSLDQGRGTLKSSSSEVPHRFGRPLPDPKQGKESSSYFGASGKF